MRVAYFISPDRGLGQRLPVGDLRTAHAGLDVEFALQAVDDDFEMQLARASQEDCARLLIDANLDGRVLGSQPLERLSKPPTVLSRFRHD